MTTVMMDACLIQSFSARIYLTSSQNLSVLIGLGLTSPVILVLNLTLIFCLVKTKELRKASGVLLLLLSISDCSIGAVAIPLQIVLFGPFKGQHACTLECAAHAFAYFTSHFSGYLIAVITFQRSVYIDPHLKSQNVPAKFLVKKTGLIMLVTVTVIVTIAETLASVIFYHKFVVRLVLTIIDSVTIAYVYVTYFWMYFKVWRFSKGIIVKQRQKVTRSETSEDRLVKTVALILMSAAMCCFPFIILLGLKWKRQRNGRTVSTDLHFAIYLSYILVYSNSAINVAMIIFRSTKMRKYIISLLRGKPKRVDTLQRRHGNQFQGFKASGCHPFLDF